MSTLADIHHWAEAIAEHFGDDWPHTPTCQGEAGCPLCLILEASADVEYIPPTEPKPGTRWEYGFQRDATTAMGSRERAVREIERQRTRPRGYRITGQKLVRRLVSDWEEVQ